MKINATKFCTIYIAAIIINELQVLELKYLAVVLLEAMLCEETHQGSQKFVQIILKKIDKVALHETLTYFFNLRKDPYMVGDYSQYILKLIVHTS